MNAEKRPLKVYVAVTVDFDADGQMFPRALVWEDGERYEIDRVKDIRPAPAKRAGGQGDCYTVIIGGREKYLFFERISDYASSYIGRWFVERKGE